MKLLVRTAEFENILKETLARLIKEKINRWNNDKKEASERMNELSEYFTGEKALTRVKKNDSLKEWFYKLHNEINNKLDINKPIAAGHKINQLITALMDIEDHHQIQNSLQVKQFLNETRDILKKMIRTLSVNERIKSHLDIVSDFHIVAWCVIHDYIQLMHNMIKDNPNLVLLKNTFKKLSSILDQPLVRIMQINSKDQISVAEYHSSQLVQFVRNVLDIIPKSVFKTLDEIIYIQTHQMKVIPTKMERKYLKEFAQLEIRHMLAKHTDQVSVYTEGILAMKATLIGIIQLNPKNLLEDGIRKELVRQIAQSLNDYLIFKNDANVNEFEQRLTLIGNKLDGYKRSFEYIQDYINLYGLKIWQEEFSRIINYNIEQECNQFLKKSF